MKLIFFRQVGLPFNTDDERVWRRCQENNYLLLTGNRSTTDGTRSLEFSILRLLKPDSLPVVTIGNLRRVKADPAYCQRCAEDLADIVLDLETSLGVSRLFIPARNR